MIPINSIIPMQRCLIRARQIPGIMNSIKNEEYIEPILLLSSKNKIFLRNGHHRLEAYKRCGRTYLKDCEYFMVLK